MVNAYSAWLAPSSRYPRILLAILIFTFIYVLSYGLIRRLGCQNVIHRMGIVIYGNEPIVVLIVSIVITFVIPSDMLSLFLWHFAYGPIKQSTSQSINQSANQSINQSIDQSFNRSSHRLTNTFRSWLDAFQSLKSRFMSTSQSVNPSVSQSDNQSVNQSISQSINPLYDSSSDQSYNAMIDSTNLDNSLGVELVYDRDARHQSIGDQSVDQSINQSTSQSISQSINQQINKSNQLLLRSINHPVNKSVSLSVDQSHYLQSSKCDQPSINQSTSHSTKSINQSAKQLINQSISQSFITRICNLLIWPVVFFMSPQSINRIFLQNTLIDACSNIFHLLLPNLRIGARGINQYSEGFFMFFFNITGKLTWYWLMTPVAEAIQVLNEFLLLPMYYRANFRTGSQSNNRSNNRSINRSINRSVSCPKRSIIWIGIVIMVLVTVYPRFVPSLVFELDSCLLCEYQPVLAHFLLDVIGVWMTSPKLYFCIVIFITLTFILLIDQARHFRNTKRCDHQKCGCKLLYLLFLCILCGQECGMAFMLRVTTDMVAEHASVNQSIDQSTNQSINQSGAVTMLFFYVFSCWWQYLIRLTAHSALPYTSDIAVLFPIQLVEDVYNDLMFASLTPFSFYFFLMSVAQTIKMFLRDADVISDTVLTYVRKWRNQSINQSTNQSINQSINQPINQSSRDESSKQARHSTYNQFSEAIIERSFRCRVLRHQNLLVELCAKVVVLSVVVSDLIPLGSNPTWMPVGLGEIGGVDQKHTRMWIMIGMIYLILLQLLAHGGVMKFIDWREKRVKKQSINQSINQSVNEFDQHIDIPLSVISEEASVHSDDVRNNQSVNQPVNQPIDSLYPSLHSINQSVNQSLNHQQLLDDHWTRHFFFFFICIIRFVPFLLVLISGVLIMSAEDETQNTYCVEPIFTSWQLLDEESQDY